MTKKAVFLMWLCLLPFALPQAAAQEVTAAESSSAQEQSGSDSVQSAAPPPGPSQSAVPPRPRPPGGGKAPGGRPKPRGFEGVDQPTRSPMGFYQNWADNSIKSIREHGQDGDYAVIAGKIADDLEDGCYMLQDTAAELIKICRLEETVPADLQLQQGGEYIFWIRVNKSLFATTLDVLMMAEN